MRKSSFIKNLASYFPELKRKLRMANMNKTPEEYISQVVRNTALITVMLTFISFMIITKMRLSLLLIPLTFLIFLFSSFILFLKNVDARITKRAKEIDKDVIFAGRFLMVKLSSGRPLLNALIEASQSYGAANRYFKELVRDVELGTPVEKAIENASVYNPSSKLRRIFFQITNAIKIGIDVTRTLEATVDEIAQEQLIEIQRYGKKLNSFTMFYMLLGIVIPSLGWTLIVIVASFTAFSIGFSMFIGMTCILITLQVLFLILFKAIRPIIAI